MILPSRNGMWDDEKHLRAPILVALEAGIGLESGFQLELARHLFHDGMAVRAHQPARVVRAAGQLVRSPRSWQGDRWHCFPRRYATDLRPERVIPPTPRPPPAFTCADPGPWQFSQSNLPFCVFPIRPMSVWLNSSACLAWQVAQTFAPTEVASTGTLGCVPPATGPFFGAAEGCAEEPP